jgi:hypothetical protein
MKRLKYRFDNHDVSQKRLVNDYFLLLSSEKGFKPEKKFGG